MAAIVNGSGSGAAILGAGSARCFNGLAAKRFARETIMLCRVLRNVKVGLTGGVCGQGNVTHIVRCVTGANWKQFCVYFSFALKEETSRHIFATIIESKAAKCY